MFGYKRGPFLRRRGEIVNLPEVARDLSFKCCGNKKKYAPTVICSKCNDPVKVFTNYSIFSDEEEGFNYILCRHCVKPVKADGADQMYVVQKEQQIRKANGEIENRPQRTARFHEFTHKVLEKTMDEPSVWCSLCLRKFHKLCTRFVGAIPEAQFVCEECQARDPQLSAEWTTEELLKCEYLLKTPLSDFIEVVVNEILRRKRVGEPAKHVHVRVLSSVPKVHKLANVLAKFLEKYNFPNQFSFNKRMIMCFQERGPGKYAAFFTMYTQEYGGDVPLPNKNSVYISLMDSAKLFSPPTLRKEVYYGIIITYFRFAISLGAENVFLWACPPLNDTEYVFFRRPIEQRNLALGRLVDWYKGLMNECLQTQVITNWMELGSWCERRDKTEFFKNFPLFHEDHWPREMIRVIKGVRKGEIKEVAEKPQQKSKSKKGVVSHLPFGPKDEDTIIFENMSELMRRSKNFFQMSLNRGSIHNEEHFKRMMQPNPRIDSVLANHREALIKFLRVKNLRFGDIDESVYSTKHILLQILGERPRYFCDICIGVIFKGKMNGKSNVTVCCHCWEKFRLSDAAAHFQLESEFVDIWFNIIGSGVDGIPLAKYAFQDKIEQQWCRDNQRVLLAIAKGAKAVLRRQANLMDILTCLDSFSQFKAIQVWEHITSNQFDERHSRNGLFCHICSEIQRLEKIVRLNPNFS